MACEPIKTCFTLPGIERCKPNHRGTTSRSLSSNNKKDRVSEHGQRLESLFSVFRDFNSQATVLGNNQANAQNYYRSEQCHSWGVLTTCSYKHLYKFLSIQQLTSKWAVPYSWIWLSKRNKGLTHTTEIRPQMATHHTRVYKNWLWKQISSWRAEKRQS